MKHGVHQSILSGAAPPRSSSAFPCVHAPCVCVCLIRRRHSFVQLADSKEAQAFVNGLLRSGWTADALQSINHCRQTMCISFQCLCLVMIQCCAQFGFRNQYFVNSESVSHRPLDTAFLAVGLWLVFGRSGQAGVHRGSIEASFFHKSVNRGLWRVGGPIGILALTHRPRRLRTMGAFALLPKEVGCPCAPNALGLGPCRLEGGGRV